MQKDEVACEKGAEQSQGRNPLSFPCSPSRAHPFSFSLDLALPFRLPKAKEAEPLLQGHPAWPGRSSDLNPGLLAPGLPHHSGQQAGPVPWVSHAPGLWPPCP